MKSTTNYFRNALLAAQYPVIEYKDKVFETISWEEISNGCLMEEKAIRFRDDVTIKEEDNEKPKKSVVIALKTVLTEYKDGGKINNDLEDLTSVFFLPAYLLQSGVLCVPDNQEPWIPREFLAPMVESLFVIGHADEFDDFLERTTERRVQIETWEAYLSYAIELYESVTKIKFFEDPFEKYKIRFDNKFYIFEYQKIDSVMNLLKAYNELQYDEEPKLYTKITQCSIEPSRKIQSSTKREKMIGHVGQMGGEYPLSPSQRESISCFQEIKDGEVLAVNGPPGTGKTTLLQSIVADMYVKKALKREMAPIVVATSTNNQAVTNIIESFGKINPIGIKNLEKRWVTGVHSFAVYFPSKGKETEAKRNNYQYTNVAGEAFVEEVESEDNRKNSQQVFDEAFIEYFGYKRNSLSEAVERIHAELLRVDKQRIQCIESMMELVKILGQKGIAEYLEDLSTQIEHNEKEINICREEMEGNKQKGKQLIERCNSWRKSYEELPWYIRLFKFITCFRRKIEAWSYEYMSFDELNFLNRGIRIDEIENTYHRKIQKNDECIQGIRRRIEMYEKEMKKCIDEKEEVHKKISSFVAVCSELVPYQVRVTKESLYKDIDIKKLNDQLDKVRYIEFWLAVHYYEALWLATQYGITDNQKGKTFAKVLDTMYHRIAMLSPCMVMTCYMLPKQFWAYNNNEKCHYNMHDYADLLIVDEAGQISVEIGAVTFAFARKAIVVGDERQIPPVWSVRKALDISMAIKNGVIEISEQYEKLEKMGLNCSQSSIMKIASLSSPYEKYGKGLFLSEHRRCYNEIIQYCNELVYGGNLEPLRGSFQNDDSNVISDLLLPMNHVQVDTAYSQRVGTSRQNKNEAEAIVEWISENFSVILERYQLRAEDKQLDFNSKLVLGIITPFKSQSTLIKRLINKRLPDYAADISVGTVHTFQGAERNVIIFSSVYGNQEGCFFINRNTNLMNVAVSRAKDAFVVIGDVGCLVGGSNSAAGLLKEFCQKSVF